MHIPDFKQEEVCKHGFELETCLVFGESDLGGHDVEVLRRAGGKSIVSHLRDREDGHALEIQSVGELYNALGFTRERDEDKEVILPRRLVDGVEFLASCNLVDEDVVVDEETLHFLHDVRLHIAGGVGKDAVCFADEAARARVVAPHELAPRLIVEAAERGDDIALGQGA